MSFCTHLSDDPDPRKPPDLIDLQEGDPPRPEGCGAGWPARPHLKIRAAALTNAEGSPI